MRTSAEPGDWDGLSPPIRRLATVSATQRLGASATIHMPTRGEARLRVRLVSTAPVRGFGAEASSHGLWWTPRPTTRSGRQIEEAASP
jgi:hypothetical protein